MNQTDMSADAIERFNSGRIVPPQAPFPEGTEFGRLLFLSERGQAPRA
jgi:hypothetical protein